MNPRNQAEASQLLQALGAPPHLRRHVELVGEAAEDLLAKMRKLRVVVDENFFRIGVVLHDIGKIRFPAEMFGSGAEHETEGERMLLEVGIDSNIAKVCLSHARWKDMDCTLEELMIALSDTLWKGVRNPELEEAVIAESARRVSQDKWDLFVILDDMFERIADRGHERLLS